MRTVVTLSSVLLVVLTALSAGVVLAQSPASKGSSPMVTGSGQPATAAVVAHFTRDMSAAPHASAAQLVATASVTADASDRVRLGRQGLLSSAQTRAAAAHLSAPRSDFVSRGVNIDVRTSFAGIQASNAICPPIGCNPPDMALGVSPKWVFEGDNTAFAVYDRQGNIQPGWPKTFFDFFGVPDPGACAGDIPFTSDPRAFYDIHDGRFFVAALELEGSIANSCPLATRYWIAASQTSNPNGAWNVYAFDMSLGTTNIADFTQIGLDSQHVTFSANMFTSDTLVGAYAEIFAVSKQRMEAGLDITAPGFFNLTVTGPAGSFQVDTVQPTLVEAEDGDPGADLFVGTFGGFDTVSGHTCTSDADSCRGLGVWALRTGEDGTLRLSFAYVGNTKAYSFAPPADQPSCTQCIDSNDLRIGATPVFRNGLLYVSWGTGLDNGTQVVPGIVWSEVSASLDDGRLIKASQLRGDYFNFGGDDAVIYPALMPDGHGNLFMMFDHMSSTVNPEVRLTALHGNGTFASPGVLVKAGEAPYRVGVCGHRVPVCRWGDYSATSLDGFENGHVWFAGQYANASGFRLNWGTFIGEA